MAAPYDDSRIEAFGLLLEAHAAVVGAVERDLRGDGGMPLTWFEVLIRLARSPDRRLRLAELAERSALSASGLTRVLDHLVEAGHICRQACPEDRRGLFAVLTPRGARTLARALPGHLDSLERWMAEPVGSGGLEALVPLLHALLDGVRAGKTSHT